MKPVKDNLKEIRDWYERNKDSHIAVHAASRFAGRVSEPVMPPWNIAVAERIGTSGKYIGTAAGPAALQIYTLTDEFEIMHDDILLIGYTPTEKTSDLCTREYNRLVVRRGTVVNIKRIDALLEIGVEPVIALRLGVEDDN